MGDPERPEEQEELVDAVPVLLDEPHPIERPPEPGALVLSVPHQAAALAAAGFIAGLATVAAIRRGRRPPRAIRRGRRRGEQIRVQSTRSFLVDVHLLDR
jgi:hypothetical protein